MTLSSFFKTYLDPADRLSEILFGLVMVLTFTLGAGLIVKESGAAATSGMILGILGCNLAWGLIDGMTVLISALFNRSLKARMIHSLQAAATEEIALSVIKKELDDRLKNLTALEERKVLYHSIFLHLKKMKPEKTRFQRSDFYSAFASFLMVFLSTLPAVIPFLFLSDRLVALRVSNLLLLLMLFLVGYRLAKALHVNSWLMGSSLMLLGLVMVAVVIALGG